MLLILVFLPLATDTVCYYNNKWMLRIIITSGKRGNDKLAFMIHIGKVVTNTLLKASGTILNDIYKYTVLYSVRFAHKTREHQRYYSRYLLTYLHAFTQCGLWIIHNKCQKELTTHSSQNQLTRATTKKNAMMISLLNMIDEMLYIYSFAFSQSLKPHTQIQSKCAQTVANVCHICSATSIYLLFGYFFLVWYTISNRYSFPKWIVHSIE